MKKLRSFWEKCDKTFAHITADKWLVSVDNLLSSFAHNFTHFNPTNKVIVDYGIGAGYLGMYLFNNFLIKKYIGIDIAQRSLDAASNNLSLFKDKTEFFLVPVDFSSLNADMFCSFAVIQHFPDQKYLDSFLTNLNNSKISELILQIRHCDRNKFSKKYRSQKDAQFACYTNNNYISSILLNYQIISVSDIDKISNYCTLHYKLL